MSHGRSRPITILRTGYEADITNFNFKFAVIRASTGITGYKYSGWPIGHNTVYF